MMTGVQLSIFISRVESVCQEMGAVLRRTAFSTNIKDRLDFSCALFDGDGKLFSQAAHIPVHLGSMAYAMADIVSALEWRPGDVLALNDPFLGGTHLPDVTVVSPYYCGGTLVAFVANRAHHANIGAKTPGSMPRSSTIEEEGVLIPPTFIRRRDQGADVSGVLKRLQAVDERTIDSTTSGDFAAQMSANQVGIVRLDGLVQTMGVASFLAGIDEINEYGERLATHGLAKIPNGQYCYGDVMDDDGFGNESIPIRVTLTVSDEKLLVDFSGTSDQVKGNINCPLSVAAAAVFYVFRCLLPGHTPACDGVFRPLEIAAPIGSLVNAERPAAVAAGNVETSMRIVDVVLGALRAAIPDAIPSDSQGTMNNIAMGSRRQGDWWDYYETVGGGMGAHRMGNGLSARQSHMTNTLNTPVESVEMHFPIRIKRYEIRRNSGGRGRYRGGDGIIREYEFKTAAQVTILSERRTHAPLGSDGGEAGQRGINLHNGMSAPGKCEIQMNEGDVLTIMTPGGGGWGTPRD